MKKLNWGRGAAAKFSKGKAREERVRENEQGAVKKCSFIPHHGSGSEGTCRGTLGTRKTCGCMESGSLL